MKIHLLMQLYRWAVLVLVFVVNTNQLNAQNQANGWTATLESSRSFIENKGQFRICQSDEQVLFAYDAGSCIIYFTPKGVTYTFIKRWAKEEREKEKAKERVFTTIEAWKEKEEEEKKMEFATDLVSFRWQNANPEVEIIPEEVTPDYHSYTFQATDGKVTNINMIKGYKKLTYKNIYSNIDIEYTFHPTDGIKYALILHPGADVSQISMNYSRSAKTDSEGNIRIRTKFGDIIDHKPVTFYADDPKNEITSGFSRDGKKVSFELGATDNGKTVVIDPWTQTPMFINSNAIWECERDGSGNAYLIGGDMPMKLQKYNAAGALQWTYNTPYDSTNYWLGTFATDLAGNSYVTSGSIAGMQKITSAGSAAWTYTAPLMSSDEYWNIAFNCDQTKLIIGGTTGNAMSLKGAIFDVNTTNGSVLSTEIVGAGDMFAIPMQLQEVRSMTSCRNGRYYFLTLDTIGCIEQDFNACSGSPVVFKTNSSYGFSYKCENFKNRGNSGIMAIRANRYFVYTQNGTTVHKRSLFDGSILATASIPGGISITDPIFGQHQVGNSGLDIDSCGNVYVGSGNAVLKYDADLNLITNVPVGYHVYDVAVSANGQVIACGTTGVNSDVSRQGTIQSIDMSACDPMTLYCCNANVCDVGPFCSTDGPVTITPISPGGTFTGTGITNGTTGTFDPSVAGPGNHTVVYTMPCGSDSIVVVVNACATLTACQELNGDITVHGGTGPYTWYKQTFVQDCSACVVGCVFPPGCAVDVPVWTSFTTGTTITPPGTYPLQVTDVYGNTLVVNSLASLPACTPCPSMNIVLTNINEIACFGDTDGSFDMTVSVGTSPYDFLVTNASGGTVSSLQDVTGTQQVSNLPAGTYTIVVTDAEACTGTTTVTISQPTSLPDVSVTNHTDVTCNQTNGAATASASGGTGPYSFAWSTSPVQQTANAINMPAGLFTVTVTDANGCTATDTVTIWNSGGPNLQTSSTNAVCGQNNGNASVTATGGTGTYTYTWSTTPPQNTASITDLAAGTYTVTVDDGNCAVTASVVVSDIQGINVNITSVSNETCGNSNGSATAMVSGGLQPISYNWSSVPPQNTSNLHGVPAGTYYVTVTDASMCTEVDSVTIVNLSAQVITPGTIIDATCGQNNGSASVDVAGGQAPYTFSWNTVPPQSTQTIVGVQGGTYTVTVTDANYCTASVSLTIATTQAPTVGLTSTNEICNRHDGSISVTATGGSGSYSYNWSNGDTASAMTDLAAGFYSVTVSDGFCTVLANTTILNSGGPLAEFTFEPTHPTGENANVSFYNESTGAASLLWDFGTTTGETSTLENPVFTYPTPGTYQITLTVTSPEGCIDTAVKYITILPMWTFYIPNAFTPGDNDLNEVFKPKGTFIEMVDYKFLIFNRWGELIFQTKDVNEGWDGTMNGEPCPSGVYVYTIECVPVYDKEQTYIGHVTLVR
ncbi:MAG: gliding motility-associated C-terminal domain-containing protein [Bacteroidetes bacterium]|nr:gliding motility-associated C-terminal domain-containing protein [Bacteroidota bacterium]MBU1719990.1 gliding motility-associated C-terminal domain-containing protein [Bacteroidota bacterium]